MTLPQRPDHACWHISTSLVCWRMCAQEAHIKYLRKRWRKQSERWQHANISVRERKKTREKGRAESGLHTTATLMWFFCKVSSHITGLEDSYVTMSMQVHTGGGLVAQLNCRIYHTAAVIHKKTRKTCNSLVYSRLSLCFAQEHCSEGHTESDKIKSRLKHNQFSS